MRLWSNFGFIFGCLGGRLVSFLVVLGGVWSFWGGLERSRAVLGRPLVAATPRVRYLGRFLNRPGGPRWIFGSPWGPKRAPKRSPKTTNKRSENRCQKRSHVRTVSRPTWGDLGPILVPSWGQEAHFWKKSGCGLSGAHFFKKKWLWLENWAWATTVLEPQPPF